MLNQIKKFFDAQIDAGVRSASEEDREHAVRVATAALMFEISRADTTISEVERKVIARTVQKSFGLPAEESAQIIALAEEEVEHSVSLYQFTSLVDEHFAPEQKRGIIELLWRVSVADGHVDPFEEHIIRKVSDLLHVSHAEFIRSKHRALGHDVR